MRDLSNLVRTATSQYGLLSTRQLRDQGVTKSAQATLVRHGVLEPIRAGVVGIAGAAQSWEQQVLAVIMMPGSSMVASHRSVLRLRGLWNRFSGVEITTAGVRRRPKSVIVHRSTDLVDDDVEWVGPIPATTVERALADVAGMFPPTHYQRLLDHAVADGLTTAAQLEAFGERVHVRGRRGIGRFLAAIDRLEPTRGAESGPEASLVRLLSAAGLPAPVLQLEVVGQTGLYRLDVAYPDARLGLEYDGVDAHTRIHHFTNDRRRQNDLVGMGWTILRFTWADVRDRPHEIVAQVRRHLPPLVASDQ